MIKVLGIIPAREGSKGVPQKNIKLLGQKPLLQYSIEAALNANLISDCIVSTDSETIAAISEKLGLTVPFLRPAELATDDAKSIDVVLHSVEFMAHSGKFYDAVCLLQPTTPFRLPGFIDKAIKKFVDSETDSLISVLPVPHEFNPYWLFKKNDTGTLKMIIDQPQIISRRQDLPSAYYRDGSIYITKTNIILERKSFFGDSIGFIESDVDSHVNIDTSSDWHKAEQLLLKIETQLGNG